MADFYPRKRWQWRPVFRFACGIAGYVSLAQTFGPQTAIAFYLINYFHSTKS